MGGCATKPKVLKDDDEKPASPPPTQKVDDKDKEVAVVAPAADTSNKNVSLSNLFDKESEGHKRVPDITFQANSQEAGTSKSMETLEEKKLPSHSNDASKEKIASQDSRIIPEDYTDALEKLSVPVVAADTPAEKLSVNETDAQTEKNIKQTEEKEEKSAGEVFETMPPIPDIVTDVPPTEKIESQGSVIIHEEFTDALEKYPAVVRVADVPNEKVAVENTNAVVEHTTKQTEDFEKPAAIENLKQNEDGKSTVVVHDQKKPEEISDVAEEKNPEFTEDDKKVLEENVAVEKQIEIVDSIIAAQESDIKEVKSDVVPVEIK